MCNPRNTIWNHLTVSHSVFLYCCLDCPSCLATSLKEMLLTVRVPLFNLHSPDETLTCKSNTKGMSYSIIQCSGITCGTVLNGDLSSIIGTNTIGSPQPSICLICSYSGRRAGIEYNPQTLNHITLKERVELHRFLTLSAKKELKPGQYTEVAVLVQTGFL